jgi:hypothetical protein
MLQAGVILSDYATLMVGSSRTTHGPRPRPFTRQWTCPGPLSSGKSRGHTAGEQRASPVGRPAVATIEAKMPPDLSRRAETLLEFWFAPTGSPERDRLRDIWFQATRNSTPHSAPGSEPITIERRPVFTSRGGTRRRPASL